MPSATAVCASRHSLPNGNRSRRVSGTAPRRRVAGLQVQLVADPWADVTLGSLARVGVSAGRVLQG